MDANMKLWKLLNLLKWYKFFQMNVYNISFIILIILLNFKNNNCYLFSVVMAIYNTGRYLDESINSLLNQTIGYKEIQIILVNDGSTDNSEEICKKYQKVYKNNISEIFFKFSYIIQ